MNKIQVATEKEAPGRRDTRQTDGSKLLWWNRSPTRWRAMFSHSCAGADGYFCKRERASRLNYSSADWPCTHFTSAGTCRETRLGERQRRGGAEEEREEEGRCHKHGNQSDRRREVGIKEQQEKRSPGISSLISLLSCTS